MRLSALIFSIFLLAVAPRIAIAQSGKDAPPAKSSSSAKKPAAPAAPAKPIPVLSEEFAKAGLAALAAIDASHGSHSSRDEDLAMSTAKTETRGTADILAYGQLIVLELQAEGGPLHFGCFDDFKTGLQDRTLSSYPASCSDSKK